MKDRIIQFLAAEKISASEFADKIGVQRSSMSHILNGRNYPSASFLQKMLQAYPAVNSRWLMIGDGSMNMDSSAALSVTAIPDFRNDESVHETSVFPVSDPESGNSSSSEPEPKNVPLTAEQKEQDAVMDGSTGPESFKGNNSRTNEGYPEMEQAALRSNQPTAERSIPPAGKEIEQVLFFFGDKTFRVYLPS